MNHRLPLDLGSWAGVNLGSHMVPLIGQLPAEFTAQ